MKHIGTPKFLNTVLQRVLKNTAYLFSATGISAGLGMVQSIFVARLLGVEGFGVLGALINFTSVLNKLASFRMNELVVKYVGHYTVRDEKQKAAAVFKIAALTEITASFLAYGLIWLLAPLGARYFVKDSSVLDWFLIYGLIVLANLITESSTGLLQIFDRFRRLALLNILGSGVTLVLIILVFLSRQGAFEMNHSWDNLPPMLLVILAYMVGKVVGAAGLALLALSEAGHQWGRGWWRTPLRQLRGQLGELVRFAISTNLSASLNLINKDSELLWVAFFRNPTEVGYYKLALSLANLVQMPVEPMPNTTYPELAREVAEKRWQSVRLILRQGSLVAGGYALIAVLGLVLLGKPLIHYLYTPQYLPAYPALLILMVGYLVADTFYWRRVALLALGLPDYLTKVNFVAALAKIGGAVLLLPIFGYLGCAALLAAFYVFPALVNVRKALTTLSRFEKQAEDEAALAAQAAS